MDKLVIRGGLPLRGEVPTAGAKNAALPALAATLLAEGTYRLSNVPPVADVRTMQRLLALLGVEARPEGESWIVASGRDGGFEAPYDLVKTMRASVLVLGPLVARRGRARVSLPGGCAIGARPIDQHLKGLARMGARIDVRHGYVEATTDGARLRGAHIVPDLCTVTGTENLMMAAALADGETIIENAAREPEVADLAAMLAAMGARIEGAGTSVVRIEGVPELCAADHVVVPDRIEAGTLIAAAALTGGEVKVARCRPEHQGALLAALRGAGVEAEAGTDYVWVRGPATLGPVDVVTQPYPGFPTDMQAQMLAVAARAQGVSRVTETIFENRFMHVPELVRMGADIALDGRTATVRGGRELTGAQVMATDLRASACLVLAGLVAAGTTEVLRVYHLDRGYARLDQKLAALGASIDREAGGP